MSAFAAKARLAWQLLLASYFGMLLILLAGTFSNPPESITSTVMLVLTGIGIWLFKVAPLLLFIPGLLQRRHKTAAWLAYMNLLYFVLAVMLVFTPGAGIQGWLLVSDSLLVFLSAMLFIRWQKRLEAGF
jgi:uncharacterized membrane protein